MCVNLELIFLHYEYFGEIEAIFENASSCALIGVSHGLSFAKKGVPNFRHAVPLNTTHCKDFFLSVPSSVSHSVKCKL